MDKTDEYYRFPKIMEDEVFEAEIVSDSSDKTLNITLAATFAFSIVVLFLGANVGHLIEAAPSASKSNYWWGMQVLSIDTSARPY